MLDSNIYYINKLLRCSHTYANHKDKQSPEFPKKFEMERILHHHVNFLKDIWATAPRSLPLDLSVENHND